MGKKVIKALCIGLLAAAALGAGAKPLPVSKAGRQTEQMYMAMMQGFLAEVHDEPDSCRYYEQAAAYDRQNKYIRELLLICAITQNQLDKADEYADFINQPPHDSEDLTVYAFYQWRKGNFAQARSYYEQALQQSPDDSRALYQYVLLLSSLDLDKAVEALQSRKEMLPELAAALDYETGNVYMRHKQWAQALQYYQAAIEARPSYTEPRLAKAEIYEKTSQFFLMMHELEELEKLGYSSAAMYARMGSFYVLAKDDSRAKTYFLQALELDPSNDVAGYFLAIDAEQEQNWPQAAHYLQQTAGYAQNASRWLQVSFYQQQAGDTAAALQTLQQAYKRFENNVEIGYFYALLLQDAGKYRQAANVLRGILETNPSYEQARLAYAFALEGSKKYTEMEAQIKLIVAQNQSNASAYNLLGFSLAERNIRLQEAQEAVTKALSLRPEDRSFIDSLAWVYYRQGKYEQALALLTSLDGNFISQNAEVQYHLGAVYAAMGETEKARVYLQSAAQEIKPAAKLLKRISR